MTDPASGNADIIGCILAGGLSRRMGGGDKTLKVLGEKPMLGSVIDRLRTQTPHVIINANGDPQRLQAFDLPVVADAIAGFAGPLAGLSACMDWTADHYPDATHIATVAADTPFFPTDLVSRLMQAITADEGEIAIATSGGHHHPVFGLWPVSLRHHLTQWMQETDTYKVMAWARLHRLAMVDFPMIAAVLEDIDPFFNVNTPADLSTAEALLEQMQAQENG